MDLKQYKMCRSKNFPLPQQKKNTPQHDSIATIALLNDPDTNSYEVHQVGEEDVLLFGEREYLKRHFDHIVKNDERVETEEGENKSEMVENVLQIIHARVCTNQNNMIVIPVLETYQMNKIIFPNLGYQQGDSEIPETPDCIIKTVINDFLQNKKNNTIISLSIMGIKGNGSLTDQLNYDWLEETQDIEKAIREKIGVKISKQKQQVKAFELNRQQITNWEDAREILFHYHQLSSYVEYWRNSGQGCQEKVGELYSISQVEVDSESGSILHTARKCEIVRINQYLKQSNLIMMRLSQGLHDCLNGIKSKNTRDYPLLMFLNDCFSPSKKYKITLFSQIGTMPTLKEESMCLSMNLQVPYFYLHLKNYWDHKKALLEVKSLSINFPPQQSTQVPPNTNQKTLKLLEEGKKVAIKSFHHETQSSQLKKKIIHQTSISNAVVSNRLDENESELIQVYKSKKTKQKR